MSDLPPSDEAAKSGRETSAQQVSATPHNTSPYHPSRVKRFLKRFIFGALLILLLVQIPFIYRRFELRALHRSLEEMQKHHIVREDAAFREYVGVLHVHTSLGGHSTGTLAEVIKAAQANKLDFVVMTEHTEGAYDSAALTLAGLHGGVLFIPGNETQTRDGSRFLVLPGGTETGVTERLSTLDFTRRERGAGRTVIAAYPDDFKEWNEAEYDGIEIYNLFTNARRARPFTLFFDSLWSLGGYPELIFTRFAERPTAALARWDKLASTRDAPLAALAGNDAHANVGIHLRLASGERLAGIQLDPYERSFRIVRMHALLPVTETLNRETLLAALRSGRAFIGFDVFGDSSGFRFTATNGADVRMMGEQVFVTSETALHVRAPIMSRIILFRNGEKISEAEGTEATFAARQPGAYRAEVYFKDTPLLADMPWIVSNHIHVK